MAQWDPAKRERNLADHGIDFADCEPVLLDDFGLERPDPDHGEPRWVRTGLDRFARLVTLAYTWRGDEEWLISARHATSAEARTYTIRRKGR